MILYLELHGVRWTLCICLVPRNAHNPNQTPSVNSPKKSTNFLIFILARHHWSALTGNYFDIFHRHLRAGLCAGYRIFPALTQAVYLTSKSFVDAGSFIITAGSTLLFSTA